MSAATVTPITKNVSTEEVNERGYRLLTASVDSTAFHRFLSKHIDSSSEGPEAA